MSDTIKIGSEQLQKLLGKTISKNELKKVLGVKNDGGKNNYVEKNNLGDHSELSRSESELQTYIGDDELIQDSEFNGSLASKLVKAGKVNKVKSSDITDSSLKQVLMDAGYTPEGGWTVSDDDKSDNKDKKEEVKFSYDTEGITSKSAKNKEEENKQRNRIYENRNKNIDKYLNDHKDATFDLEDDKKKDKLTANYNKMSDNTYNAMQLGNEKTDEYTGLVYWSDSYKDEKICPDLIASADNLSGTSDMGEVSEAHHVGDDANKFNGEARDLKNKIEAQIETTTKKINGFNENTKPSEFNQAFKELSSISYAAWKYYTWAQQMYILDINENGGGKDKTGFREAHNINADSDYSEITEDFVNEAGSYLQQTKEPWDKCAEKLQTNLKNEVTQTNNVFKQAKFDDKGQISSIKLDDLENFDVDSIVTAMESHAENLKELFTTCEQNGVDYPTADGKEMTNELLARAKALSEGEKGNSPFIKTYFEALAGQAKVDTSGDAEDTASDGKKATTFLNRLSEVAKSHGYDSVVSETIEPKQKEIQGDVQDKSDSDAKGKGKGNGSGQPDSTSGSNNSSGGGSSSGGTTNIPSASNLASNTGSLMNAANNATQTGQAIQNATGGAYTIDTSAWDDKAAELRNDAQQDINTYAQALNQLDGLSIDDLVARYNEAEAALGELNQYGGDLDLSGVSGGMGTIKEQEQTLVDQEAQTAVQQAQQAGSGTEAGTIVSGLEQSGQTYQGYGLSTGQIEQSIEQIKANQQGEINMLAQIISSQIPTITASTQAKQLLDNINKLIEENAGFDTTALAQIQGQLNAKYQELLQKETNPTQTQPGTEVNPADNPTNNTNEESAENPNTARPLDEEKSGIEVTAAGVRYHDENGDSKPSTISLTSGHDDEEEDDNFTFSLTSPKSSSNDDSDSSDSTEASFISLTSNHKAKSKDKKSDKPKADITISDTEKDTKEETEKPADKADTVEAAAGSESAKDNDKSKEKSSTEPKDEDTTISIKTNSTTDSAVSASETVTGTSKPEVVDAVPASTAPVTETSTTEAPVASSVPSTATAPAAPAAASASASVDPDDMIDIEVEE